MKKLLLSTIMASSLLTAGTAFADDGHSKGKGFGKHGAPYHKIYRKLDLNDEQKEKIKAIFKNAKSADKADKFKARQAKMQDRMKLIQADSLDNAALNKLADAQAQAMKQRFIQSAEAEHAAWKVLTPEQQQKFKEMQAKRMEKRQKRMEKRRDKKDD